MPLKMNCVGKIVEEVFQAIPKPVVYSDEEDEESVENDSIDTEVGSEIETKKSDDGKPVGSILGEIVGEETEENNEDSVDETRN